MIATFTTGLMGAGKSKHLIEQYNADKNRKVAFAAHLTETTDTLGSIESRNGSSIPAIYLNKDEEDEVVSLIKWYVFEREVESIYIDEIQFLSESVISRILYLSQFGANIYFFGLTLTFTSDYFESSKYLLDELAKFNILYIKRDCEISGCENEAEYNARIVDGQVARSGDTFVETKSTYLALCKKHYFD